MNSDDIVTIIIRHALLLVELLSGKSIFNRQKNNRYKEKLCPV